VHFVGEVVWRIPEAKQATVHSFRRRLSNSFVQWVEDLVSDVPLDGMFTGTRRQSVKDPDLSLVHSALPVSDQFHKSTNERRFAYLVLSRVSIALETFNE
jgi:hypothetical protein